MAKMISALEMVMLMEKQTRHTIVSVSTVTDPKFLVKGRDSKIPFEEKFGCPSDNIKEFSEYSSMIGLNYQHVIESRLSRQDKDASEYVKGDSWHIPYHDTKTIRQHKDRPEDLYFYLFLTTGNSHPKVRYVNTVTAQEVDRDVLKEYLPKDSKPQNQGLEEGDEVQVRTLKLSSLKGLKMNGEEYIVV
jgi:hypothetical protein